LSVCPECGAPGHACETRYHECLVKEFTDAGCGSVHHLTVAAYMLQHSSNLSREGWLEIRRLLREVLIENKAPVEVRKRNSPRVDSGRRDWKIASKDGVPVVRKTAWSKTILDVRMGGPGVYRADVTAWAKAVLADAEELRI